MFLGRLMGVKHFPFGRMIGFDHVAHVRRLNFAAFFVPLFGSLCLGFSGVFRLNPEAAFALSLICVCIKTIRLVNDASIFADMGWVMIYSRWL